MKRSESTLFVTFAHRYILTLLNTQCTRVVAPLRRVTSLTVPLTAAAFFPNKYSTKVNNHNYIYASAEAAAAAADYAAAGTAVRVLSLEETTVVFFNPIQSLIPTPKQQQSQASVVKCNVFIATQRKNTLKRQYLLGKKSSSS